jgi:hypothetical protein
LRYRDTERDSRIRLGHSQAARRKRLSCRAPPLKRCATISRKCRMSSEAIAIPRIVRM